MKISRPTFVLLSYFGLILGAFSTMGQTGGIFPSTTRPTVKTNTPASDNTKTQIDNTKRNEKMTKNAEVTAQDQGNSQKDIDLAAKVRRAIVADKSLSLNAHNVKIIAANGQVVLKGPVKNDSERTRLSQIVNEIVGVNNVKNELEVSH